MPTPTTSTLYIFWNLIWPIWQLWFLNCIICNVLKPFGTIKWLIESTVFRFFKVELIKNAQQLINSLSNGSLEYVDSSASFLSSC